MTVGIHAGFPLLNSAVRLTVCKSADIPVHHSDLQCVCACVLQHLHMHTKTFTFKWCIAAGNSIHYIGTFVCVHVNVLEGEHVLLCVQQRAPRFWPVMILEVWHTERGNSFRFGPRQRSALLVCDNLQSKWAAAEGDSVSGGNGTGCISPSNWWCWGGFRARRDGVIPGSLHALPLVLYTCLAVASQLENSLFIGKAALRSLWCQQDY